MRRFIFLVTMVVACFAGCNNEYVPPQDSIPKIPPSTRGVAGTNESKKADTADMKAPIKKGGAVAP